MASAVGKAVFHPQTGEPYMYPPICRQEDFEQALNYKAKATDIFICCYPRSGANWLQNVVWLILHRGIPFPDSRLIYESLPFLDMGERTSSCLAETKDHNFANIIKTHLTYRWIPKHADAKYIYIARNPRDVCVSYYHHLTGFEVTNIQNLEFSTFFDWFVEGKLPYGKYKPYIDEWNQAKDLKNILFLKYEDMKQNPKGNILRVAKFLGSEHETRMLQNDEEILKEVLHHSSLDEMTRNVHLWCLHQRYEDKPFFRKADVDDWKNHVTPDQEKTIDDLF